MGNDDGKTAPGSLLELLLGLEPITDEFPPIEDLPAEPFELGPPEGDD
jgi:hypothetical protein